MTKTIRIPDTNSTEQAAVCTARKFRFMTAPITAQHNLYISAALNPAGIFAQILKIE